MATQALAAAKDTGVPRAGALLARFLRYGLIRLAWIGGGTITPSLPRAAPPGPITPLPSTARPLLSVRGLAVSAPDSVEPEPLPAKRFAAATLALVWSNAVKDLTGAHQRGQCPPRSPGTYLAPGRAGGAASVTAERKLSCEELLTTTR